jgi:hypothetical protein
MWEGATCCAGRFNERLVLSLATNPACLLMDDELNVLPTSSHVRVSHTCITAIAHHRHRSSADQLHGHTDQTL